jgi:hypothetical protein
VSKRVDELVKRLRKEGRETAKFFAGLSDDQWKMVLYEGPPVWTVRNLLAHFLSVEEGLLRIAQDIAAGVPYAPEGLDHDALNAKEQARLADLSPRQLLADLAAARQAAIAWVEGLDEADLDRVERHPALGEITPEALFKVGHKHQLKHMRDLQALLQS